eukprot:GHVU01218967.1.p2 GENE.GHVU01218967.1~~GHVU01218967.1.p2  ORF type:complete len:115 (-),score=0.40 GHVU01218967.1:2692-3036(-)
MLVSHRKAFDAMEVAYVRVREFHACEFSRDCWASARPAVGDVTMMSTLSIHTHAVIEFYYMIYDYILMTPSNLYDAVLAYWGTSGAPPTLSPSRGESDRRQLVCALSCHTFHRA